MKKIILAAGLMLALAGVSFGQTPKKKTDKSTTATTATTAKPATAAGPTKKDGTADMRYKANKDAAKTTTTTHVKKDGTPDKRYKENKTK